MDNLETQVAKELAKLNTVTREIGTFVGVDGLRGIVDFGNGRVPADLSGYLPAVNEPVLILRIGDTVTILGPSQAKPDQGTVNAVQSGNRVPIRVTDGTILSCVYPAGKTFTIGQQVKLFWAGDFPYVLDIMSTTPPPPTPPPAPGGGGSSGSTTFFATESGSYGNGSWKPGQVWASDSNQSIWGGGSKIADTIPATATPTSVEIYLPISRVIVGAPVNIAPHAYGGITGAPAPSFGPSFPTAAGGGGWVSLNPAIANYLKAGGGYYWLGVNHGGYTIFDGVDTEPLSGALRITWN